MEGLFLELNNIKQAAGPVDANTAAITGERIKLDSGFGLGIVCNFGDSTAAVTDFTLQQHTAASGGTTKALATMNPYFHKVGTATSFTKVELTSAASNIVPTVLADEPGIIVFNVFPEDLDRDNNFSHVSINLADSTAAKLVSVHYVVYNLRNVPGYAQAL